MPSLPSKTKKRSPLAGKVKLPEPLWEGPCSETRNGGVTQSLLGAYLTCKERFRVKTIEGLEVANSRWNHRLGYGTMWHICEEALASDTNWLEALQRFSAEEWESHPLDRDAITHWYQVCKTQFPIYIDYWLKHPDAVEQIPLLQEEVFHVPYTLPSGRVVYLRGKFDGVVLVNE